jgi:hypothetical protein
MKKRRDFSRSAQLVTTAFWLSLVLGVPGGISLQAQSTCPNPPQYGLLRQDEDYSYLRDPACKRDRWDSLKYLRLGSSGVSFLTIGGEVREWYEGFHNALWGMGPQDGNGYLLQRLSAYSDFHVGRRIRIFAQLTSNLEAGRNGGPRPVIDESKLWFEQAFADITLAKGAEGKAKSLVVRLGRQQFHFGSGRLVDNREGPNVRQAFDGIALIWQKASWDVRAFATKPVLNGTGFFDAPRASGVTFWGIYAVRPLSKTKGENIDLYYLGLDRKLALYDKGVGHESRHTIGARFWGERGAWDYNTEVGLQLGAFGDGKLRAWGIVHDMGYTFRSARLQPRVGVTAAVTSGDNGNPESSLGTFNPLFPTGHYFGQGVINLNGPSNLIQLDPQIGLQFTESVRVVADNNIFWRTNLGDGIYDLATNLLVSGKGNVERYVGTQPSVGVYWQIDRHLSLSAAYGHFVAGAFLVNASPPRQSVDYAAAWVTHKF